MTGSLWDNLPSGAQGDHSLDNLVGLLDGIDGGGPPTSATDQSGRPVQRRSGHFRPLSLSNVAFDPTTGRFGYQGGSNPQTLSNSLSPTSWLSFPDFTIDWVLDTYTDATEFALYITMPSAVLTLPFLRGAKLDANQLLVLDDQHPTVRFILPRLTTKIDWTGTGQTSVKLVSATTVPGSTGTENVYQFCRMDPPHALVGPGGVFGFSFSTAELYLGADPPNLPAAARGTPSPWSGLYLPDVHVYVAPDGMQSIALAAGVRDLYIGFGEHSGVTGEIDAEVVNRGASPAISLSFIDDSGRSQQIGATDTTAAVASHGHLVVLLASGIAPYSTTIDVGGTTTTGGYVATPVEITVPAGGVTVQITAHDADPAHQSARTITLTQAAPGVAGGGGGSSPTVTTSTTGDAQLTIVSSDDTHVTVGITDAAATALSWTWDGGGSATGATATIPLTAGQQVSVTATRATSGTADLDVFYRFDRPRATEDGTGQGPPNFAFSEDAANTHTTEATTADDGAQWATDGQDVVGNTDIAARLGLLAPAATVNVTGFASFDSTDDSYDTPEHRIYNDRLANRRAAGVADLLTKLAQTVGRTNITFQPSHVSEGSGDGFAASKADRGTPGSHYWRATAAGIPLPGQESISGVVSRMTDTGTPAVPPPAPRDSPPPSPSWFRKLQLQVKLERSRFVFLKILGEVDFYTATEQQLASAQTPQHLPARSNSMDGVTDMILQITVDDAAATWSVDAVFRAVDADVDGLWTAYRPTAGSTTAIDVLGAYAALAPVLAEVAPASPSSGDVVPLLIASGSVIALATAGVLPVKQVTLHGVEVLVTSAPTGTSVNLFVDVETSIGLQAGLVSISLDHPVKVRYKAVGFALGWNPAGADKVAPTFDPSRGYTIDIPAGAIQAAGPLGDILQVLGARVSHDNPTYIETELGLAVDLGVVEVDRARVRVRLDQAEPPSLTALGAGIDVGVLRGRGYLAIDSGSGNLTGSLDVTIADPLNLRVMAGLSIQHAQDDPNVLGVFVGMELDLPAPILLGATGLGIYGFLGGVGVNMRRNENPAATIPVLDWLQRQPQQNPIDPTGWVAHQGSWAFAVGMLLGTADGGFILHLKGVVLLELPGPKLILVMKADILSVPPELTDPSQQATILAVVEIDIGAGTITIGLVVDYDIVQLITVHVPVQGFFSFSDPPDWYLDLGRYDNPVTVSVFDTFQASGYLMLHGNGITPYPPFPQLATGGFTIAVGFHVTFTWGDTGVGLYLKVAGGFDAIISFGPFALAGKIRLEGELRLFIISIGASAELDVIAVPAAGGGLQTWIHGQVCGEVDFFFFSVSGCVDFTLGDQPAVTHTPEPLVSGVQLVSRSPALVEGSGTDRSIDGVLARAQQAGTNDPVPGPVPLDAIPVVTFSVAPVVPGGFTVLGAGPLGSPGTPGNPWIRRGSLWWRYTVDSVSLTGPPLTGETPVTWWSRAATVDPAEGARLALLSWVPDPTPHAIPYGEQLTTDVHERWGSACSGPAPPAQLLFTFDGQPAGPSPGGWQLSGIAWPDPPGSFRSSPPDAGLSVTERWRCGDGAADRRRGIDPARVIADAVPCQPLPGAGKLAEVSGSPGWSGRAALAGPGWLDAASAAAATGASLSALRGAVRATGWDPALIHQELCEGGILRSPFNDQLKPSWTANPLDVQVVEAAWAKAGFKPGPLLDAIALTNPAGLVSGMLLVAVPRELLQEQLVIRSLDASGAELARVAVAASSLVVAPGTLPPQWRDPSGPWADPVFEAVSVYQRVSATATSGLGGYVLALAKADVRDGTATVEVGWDPARVKPGAVPPFYLVAAQAELAGDATRYSWDVTTQSSDQAALSAALGHEEDDHALLQAGSSYTLGVTWHAEWKDQSTQPAASDSGTNTGSSTQSFSFGTEGAAQAPARLDPWVLSTAPGADEQGVFCDDPTRVVFATQKVAGLFAAYGDTLELMLRSASGNHPQPGGPRSPNGAIARVPVSPAVLGTGGRRVLSPWEQAVRDVVLPDATCISAGSRDEHSVVEIDYPFEPCTDYLMDIVRRPSAGGDDLLVFRRGFTTGRFRSLAEFADTFAGVRVTHRGVDPTGSALLLALAEQPAGDAVDAAFAGAGLDRPVVPRIPKVQVLWTAEATAQPVAVVVEAAEPLWRSHAIPTQVPTNNPRDPSGMSWRDVVTEYLRLERDPSSSAAVGPHIVRAPGLQRAVVLLPAGQRGTTLVLRLSRDADPLAGGSTASTAVIATIDLLAAPWEDPDA
jgi:large repetitive protein